MSVLRTNSFSEYTARGIANEQFTIDFNYDPAVSSIRVYRNGTLVRPGLYEYVPAGNLDNPSIRLVGAGNTFDAGDIIRLERVTTVTQELSAPIEGNFTADQIESGLNKLTLIEQELNDKLGTISRGTIIYGYVNLVSNNAANAGVQSRAIIADADRRSEKECRGLDTFCYVKIGADLAGFSFPFMAIPTDLLQDETIFQNDNLGRDKYWNLAANEDVILDGVNYKLYVRSLPHTLGSDKIYGVLSIKE